MSVTHRPFILENAGMPPFEWKWADEVENYVSAGPYFASAEQEDHDQVWALVFILPDGGGFQAAWSCGEQDESGIADTIYPTIQVAAQMADELAKSVAQLKCSQG